MGTPIDGFAWTLRMALPWIAKYIYTSSWNFKISRRVQRGWNGALKFCGMSTEHIMKSYQSKRFEGQPADESVIEAATYQQEFSITVPGCIALLLRLCLVSKYHGDSQDIPFNMRRSASLLQGMVDMVCSKKRLVWQLERCGFPLTVDDSMVDLGSFAEAQIGAKVNKRRRACGWYIGPTHSRRREACGAQPVGSRGMM